MSNRFASVFLRLGLGFLLIVLISSGCSQRSVESIGGPSSASTPTADPFAPGKTTPARFEIYVEADPTTPGQMVANVALPINAFLSCDIRNVAGYHVKTLYSGAAEAGWIKLSWDMTNDDGEGVTGGIYFAHAEVRSWKGNAGFIIN